MVLSHTELVLAGRKGAYTRWAHADRAEASQKARTAWWRRWERLVDPDGVLPAPERQRRAEAASRAHMAGLALKSAQAKSAKAASKPPKAPRPKRIRYTAEGIPIDCAGCAKAEGRAYHDNATDRICGKHLAEMRRQLATFRAHIAREGRPTSAA